MLHNKLHGWLHGWLSWPNLSHAGSFTYPLRHPTRPAIRTLLWPRTKAAHDEVLGCERRGGGSWSRLLGEARSCWCIDVERKSVEHQHIS